MAAAFFRSLSFFLCHSRSIAFSGVEVEVKFDFWSLAQRLPIPLGAPYVAPIVPREATSEGEPFAVPARLKIVA